MRHVLVLLFCLFSFSSLAGDELVLPDGTPAKYAHGLLIFRQGNQTTYSLGGLIFPRKVKVVTNTPEGPIVTRFTLPSAFHTPTTQPFPPATPAMLCVEMPDANGLLYVEGEKHVSEGTIRYLQSPPLLQGQSYHIRFRAAFKVGENLLIEDKQVVLRAGENTTLRFEGKQAIAVPLPRSNKE